uniref:Uncharacterized protein n=1 Tax=Polysiphonia infestans TaxID=2006978 RepID=A0A1Z1MET2_9FLOR|nr:hypothetical protein [Polysiphonia infestans]ARW64362.1 hypothetical protein [Polysiphonia infestans]
MIFYFYSGTKRLRLSVLYIIQKIYTISIENLIK